SPCATTAMAAPRGRGRRAAARLPREPRPASRPRPRRARRHCFLRRRRRALFHLRECQGAAGGDRVLVFRAPLANRARLFRPLCRGRCAVAARRHPLTLIAGAIFGLLWGTLIVSFASSI